VPAGRVQRVLQQAAERLDGQSKGISGATLFDRDGSKARKQDANPYHSAFGVDQRGGDAPEPNLRIHQRRVISVLLPVRGCGQCSVVRSKGKDRVFSFQIDRVNNSVHRHPLAILGAGEQMRNRFRGGFRKRCGSRKKPDPGVGDNGRISPGVGHAGDIDDGTGMDRGKGFRSGCHEDAPCWVGHEEGFLAFLVRIVEGDHATQVNRIRQSGLAEGERMRLARGREYR
jgi:hypothetical protein